MLLLSADVNTEGDERAMETQDAAFPIWLAVHEQVPTSESAHGMSPVALTARESMSDRGRMHGPGIHGTAIPSQRRISTFGLLYLKVAALRATTLRRLKSNYCSQGIIKLFSSLETSTQ